ncbi:hypothetical protein AB0J52_06720 [Spirillospora sp. NPDC049652]
MPLRPAVEVSPGPSGSATAPNGAAGLTGLGQDPLPATFPALLELAARRFDLLEMTSVDLSAAAELDGYPHSAAWRRKTWDALATLHHYVRAHHDGHPVADLRTWTRSGAPGTLISASLIATGEHDTVQADERLRSCRTFPVRPETDPSGMAFFGAHIRLGSGKPPAPRLHYLEDLAGAGIIYIGWVGPHLPNRRTN